MSTFDINIIMLRARGHGQTNEQQLESSFVNKSCTRLAVLGQKLDHFVLLLHSKLMESAIQSMSMLFLERHYAVH